MNGIYCDEAIREEFEVFFGRSNIETEHSIYILYAERPESFESDSIIIVNGDNKELLKSLAGTEGTVITCGMSGVSTFTFSSMNDEGCVLCLQRAVTTFGGKLMQPQEIPVSLIGRAADPDRLILILAFAFLTQQSITAIKLEE